MIVFMTGAGVSVPSGLPTYRGVAGLYSDEQPVEDGYKIDEILSREVANKRPELTNKHINQLMEQILKVEPNELHEAIAEVQAARSDTQIFTQNVDDLHERGGATSVVHLHGGGPDYEDVILFGDCLSEEKLESWYDAAANAEVLVVIGTTAQFAYIWLPIVERMKADKTTYLLDPDPEHNFSKASSMHFTDVDKFAEVIRNLI